jgi:hypothetical protein
MGFLLCGLLPAATQVRREHVSQIYARSEANQSRFSFYRCAAVSLSSASTVIGQI